MDKYTYDNRYLGLGSQGESIMIVLITCTLCGCLVGDTVIHDRVCAAA